jgi:hypothetical protein
MDEAISTDEKRISFDTPHIHIDVHVHLDGSVGVATSADRRAPSAAPTSGTRRSLLTTLVVAFGVSAAADHARSGSAGRRRPIRPARLRPAAMTRASISGRAA